MRWNNVRFLEESTCLRLSLKPLVAVTVCLLSRMSLEAEKWKHSENVDSSSNSEVDEAM